MNFLKSLTTALGVSVFSTSAIAGACDWRPTHLLGNGGSAAALGTTGTLATAGGTLTAAGFYTLVHASSGLTMLGSTMAGASAAGTVGIVAGTGGAVGATAAVLMNPLVWLPAAIVGVGGAGFEASCAYFVDERVTDFDEVMLIMKSFADHSDPAYFKLVEKEAASFIVLTDADGRSATYDVDDLYVVNGVLLHRDWGPNTEIGHVAYITDGQSLASAE